LQQPRAESISRSHTNRGDAIIVVNEPKYQRIPSEESNERTPSIIMADNSHERMTSRASARRREKQTTPNSLFVISFKVVDIEYTQFKGPNHQTGGIDARSAFWEKFLDQFVLTLLKALHTKGHSTKIGDLLLGIA